MDVQVYAGATDKLSIFIAQYDEDNNLIVDETGESIQKVGRYFIPNSGYVKESTGEGEEAELPTWRQSISLKLEDK